MRPRTHLYEGSGAGNTPAPRQAQPSPKIGSRSTSRRRPRRSTNMASRLGIAMPVVEADDDAIHLARVEAGAVEHDAGGVLEQGERVVEIEPIALGEAMAGLVPSGSSITPRPSRVT